MPRTKLLVEVDLNHCEYHTIDDECRLCSNVDELECSRGQWCAGLRLGERPQPVGFYLDENDAHRSALTYAFPGNDIDVFFCEDCAEAIENAPDGEVVERVAAGDVEDISWVVNLFDGEFQAWAMTFSRSGGLSSEQEIGSFGRWTDAVDAARRFCEQIIAAEAAHEAWADLLRQHGDVISKLRSLGRLKHPTDLAIPTGRDTRELDRVLNRPTSDEPPVTVRDVLTDAARQAVAQLPS